MVGVRNAWGGEAKDAASAQKQKKQSWSFIGWALKSQQTEAESKMALVWKRSIYFGIRYHFLLIRLTTHNRVS